MNTKLETLRGERDFLLSSLRDLEVEFSAGDLSSDDYQTLKDDYTVRASDVIRSIEGIETGSSAKSVRIGSKPASRKTRSSTSGSRTRTEPATKSRSKPVFVVLGLLLFTIGSGYLLGQALGERGTGELSGSIDESLRSKFQTCQGHLQSLEAARALECYDEILAEDPKHVEALTYRGWQLYQVARGAQQSGDAEVFAQFIVMSEQSLGEAIGVDPGFADARAFRIVVLGLLGREVAACEDVVALEALRPDPLLSQLIQPTIDGLGCS